VTTGHDLERCLVAEPIARGAIAARVRARTARRVVSLAVDPSRHRKYRYVDDVVDDADAGDARVRVVAAATATARALTAALLRVATRATAAAGARAKVRSILHWSPYDPVRVVNADP